MASAVHTLVFSKPILPGQVKTRLCPPLTPTAAAELYRTMVQHALDAVSQAGLHGQVYSLGDDAWLRTQAADRGMTLQQQQGTDLGERMHNAVTASLAAGAPAVMIIGGDCPGLSPILLRTAAATLNQAEADLVIGPTFDGGYYLIGMRSPHPTLFTDLPWGSAQVLELTLAQADQLGLRVHHLPRMADIDRPADLKHLPNN